MLLEVSFYCLSLLLLHDLCDALYKGGAMKTFFVSTLLLVLSTLSSSAIAMNNGNGINIYRCVFDSSNTASMIYVPAYVCRNHGGTVIY